MNDDIYINKKEFDIFLETYNPREGFLERVRWSNSDMYECFKAGKKSSQDESKGFREDLNTAMDYIKRLHKLSYEATQI